MKTALRETPLFRMAGVGDPACPICGETRRSYLFVVRGLPVVRCPGCGLMSLNPQPEIFDIQTFYNALDVGADPRLLWTDGVTEADAAAHYLDALAYRNVTSGDLLVVAPPDHRLASEAAARGYTVRLHASIDEIDLGVDLGVERFDAAIVVYQFEKSRAPLAVLRQIHSAVRPDGILVLTIPSVDSWPAQFFGDHWTEWRPENHYYFSQTLLQSILLKGGFSEVSIRPDSRLYTLRHVADRAKAFPRTGLTRAITALYGLVPSPLRDTRLRIASSGVIVTARRDTLRQTPRCSIVVPAYNEVQTFCTLMDALLAKHLPGVQKEIIVVESNSTDGTREAALQYQSHPDVTVVLQDRPRGKGNAVRAGLARATGDVVLIQDADLEYDLNDYDALLEPLLSYRVAFVLGARHGGSWKMRQFGEQQGLSVAMNFGHVFFTGLINVLYGQKMRDPFTMFKVFRRDCLYGIELERNRFDFDHELVIKLIRKGYRPMEIPVNYRSRSFREGKKVRLLRDPLTWLWVDLKYRFVPLGRAPRG